MESTKTSSSTKSKDLIEPESAEKGDDLRLWIGNLDPKLTEFHLLKLIQRYGPIQNFDFLFHRSGPHAGLPRGYAFVTFRSKEAAKKCMEEMNQKVILSRAVVVRWANQATFEYQDEEEKLKKKLPALGMKEEPEKPATKQRAISAIEAKLRAMEREKGHQNEFNLTILGSKKDFRSSAGSSNSGRSSSSHSSTAKRYHPYNSGGRGQPHPGYRK